MRGRPGTRPEVRALCRDSPRLARCSLLRAGLRSLFPVPFPLPAAAGMTHVRHGPCAVPAPAAMPAGVPWPTYLRALAASMLAMFVGAEVVHRYYRPDLVSARRVWVAGSVCTGWRVCWRGFASERSLAWRWTEISL